MDFLQYLRGTRALTIQMFTIDCNQCQRNLKTLFGALVQFGIKPKMESIEDLSRFGYYVTNPSLMFIWNYNKTFYRKIV